MLQIDHIYEFFYSSIFKDFTLFVLPNGVPSIKHTLTKEDMYIFNYNNTHRKIFLWDQEPILNRLCNQYLNIFRQEHPNKQASAFVASEISIESDTVISNQNLKGLYYFFHGFAALDWYRGHYSLNYNKPVVKSYQHDFISYNRIISGDRSYRVYFVSKLSELNLLNQGLVSFGVTDTDNIFWQDVISDYNNQLSDNARSHAETHLTDINKLVIDSPSIPGWASADIPRSKHQLDIDCFWHIVTETVFYYDKLHLTEKIFKPIVSKQPFMLLAAPGNLAYLKNYGFKTFDSVIDESYDLIQDNDLRIEAVVKQLHWYCNLTLDEKTDVIKQLEPVIQHNFDHFYGEFRHIITRELLDNTKTLFQSIGYDDSHINYDDIHHVLTH